MPTYVYECSACEKVFEIEQRITEDPLKDCQCGSNGTVKRIIQPVGIAFKGSGFYVNDSSSVAPSSTTPKSES
jgi:putative FmdB family regulatory protein